MCSGIKTLRKKFLLPIFSVKVSKNNLCYHEVVIEEFKVAVVIASHNRKIKTESCLKALLLAVPDQWQLKIFLVDDGSTDGTLEAILKMNLNLQVIQGSGDWYWSRSMEMGQLSIKEHFDAQLWLNDDVLLLDGALSTFDIFRKTHLNSILVGQMRATDEFKLTYGGVVKKGRHPFRFSYVLAESSPSLVDTFDGNCVFIPNSVTSLIGNIDGKFSHAYGDYDFGLRAKMLGVKCLVLPAYMGVCDQNPQLKYKNIIDRTKFIFSLKGRPLSSQVRFAKRHGGIEWPIYVFTPHIKTIFNFHVKS